MHSITFFVTLFAATTLFDHTYAACNCEITSIGCVDTCINDARQCMSMCDTDDLAHIGDCINGCLKDNWPEIDAENSKWNAKVQETGAILDEDISQVKEDAIEESLDPEAVEEEAMDDAEEEGSVEEDYSDETRGQLEDDSQEAEQAEEEVQAEVDEAQTAEVESKPFENYVEDESADAEEFGNRPNIFAVTGNHQESKEDFEDAKDVTQQNEASASGKGLSTQSAGGKPVSTVTEYMTMTSHLTVLPNSNPTSLSSHSPALGSNMPSVNSAVSMETSGAIVTVIALVCAYFIV